MTQPATCSNADDRTAELNGGPYQSIPLSVRAVVNGEVEQFAHSNIAAGASFALETTLRSTITFDQAKRAKEKGFRVFMRYIALGSVERRGKIVWLADTCPDWPWHALGWTAHDARRRARELRRGSSSGDMEDAKS